VATDPTDPTDPIRPAVVAALVWLKEADLSAHDRQDAVEAMRTTHRPTDAEFAAAGMAVPPHRAQRFLGATDASGGLHHAKRPRR
jgi:hypothetical protein